MDFYKWDIKNSATNSSDVPTLYIYGDITNYSWDDSDVTAYNFKADLEALGNVPLINVRINSNGGAVFTSFAIMNLLKQNSAMIHVYIDGIAASGASIIAMAGDVIYMANGSVIMIHEASSSTWGTADDMVKVVDLLKTINAELINIYHEKTKIDKNELEAMLKKETWLNSEEAIEKGFADEIVDEQNMSVSLSYKTAVINGVSFNAHNINNAISKMKTSKNINMSKLDGNKMEDKPMDKNMTVEEFKTQNKSLYDEVKNLGVQEERKRQKDIEECTIKGYEDIASKAKFEEPMDSVQFMKEMIMAQKNKGANYLENIQKDAEEINVKQNINNSSDSDTLKRIVAIAQTV